MVDLTWELEDEDLANQWESAKNHAHNFGLWTSCQSRKEFTRCHGDELWTAFLNHFDPPLQEILHKIMVTSVGVRLAWVRSWN